VVQSTTAAFLFLSIILFAYSLLTLLYWNYSAYVRRSTSRASSGHGPLFLITTRTAILDLYVQRILIYFAKIFKTFKLHDDKMLARRRSSSPSTHLVTFSQRNIYRRWMNMKTNCCSVSLRPCWTRSTPSYKNWIGRPFGRPIQFSAPF